MPLAEVTVGAGDQLETPASAASWMLVYCDAQPAGRSSLLPTAALLQYNGRCRSFTTGTPAPAAPVLDRGRALDPSVTARAAFNPIMNNLHLPSTSRSMATGWNFPLGIDGFRYG